MQTSTQLQVCESLITEHRQMEKLLETLEQAVLSDNISAIRTVLSQIEPEMDTHFACEEQALFPAVSPYHPMVLMEVEHEELMALRSQILKLVGQASLSSEDWVQLKDFGKRFVSEMLDHIGREDAGIFPTCERALSVDEKQTVIAEMEHIRRKAEKGSPPLFSRPDRTFQAMEADLETPAARAIFSERLLTTSGTEIKHLTVRGGDALPSHWSPKQITLVCLKGTGTFQASDQDVVLKPGVVITISPQLPHGVRAETDCHLLLILN